MPLLLIISSTPISSHFSIRPFEDPSIQAKNKTLKEIQIVEQAVAS
jgi:hypothetical protein